MPRKVLEADAPSSRPDGISWISRLSATIDSSVTDKASYNPEYLKAIMTRAPTEVGKMANWKASPEKGFYEDRLQTRRPPFISEILARSPYWERLRALTLPPGPCSIYAHVPFCASRCGFCDCYAFATKAGHPLHDRYARRLVKDLLSWSSLAGAFSGPVTTVHFGGGTPAHLGPAPLSAVVEAVRKGFDVRRETEWAMETTAGFLTGPGLEFLWRLGFRRLHVGVQTLEEPLRQNLGRGLPSETVLARLSAGLRMGLVITADLLYGLPGQTIKGFLAGLERLDELGLHGLSLYRFNPSGRNAAFRRRFPQEPDAAKDFAMFVAADHELSAAGFEKNHFCHYARSRDKNLYFTHARRGEDLLAVGASADGMIGNLNYRCERLSQKFLDMEKANPLLEGSVEEVYNDKLIQAISRHLITGSVSREFLAHSKFKNLVSKWQKNKLIDYKNDKDEFVLTGSGSWHVSSMLAELERMELVGS